ncbi:DUF1360 domain-containing protein [Actinacidiphila sp. ITFR-21]|uniref:DUF1360 domain-containing protein n=1 Tax=Actinacidiphila sp. ITFR-21 TaxID=3075199 RepID=UPI00288B0B58|nr:DUF1360 domain-containing protein [Streptomyces sp. ITFR-21]WNI20402.1 DUF1360 domain-containing protein [Streptomyces sp. ITFR-21]
MINPAELGLLGLGAYRGTQLAVHDSILDPARDRIFAWRDQQPESAPRTWVVTLISCVYCMGWWVSGAILATYLLAAGHWDNAPLVVHGVEWLAVAGGQALLNRWDDSRKDGS